MSTIEVSDETKALINEALATGKAASVDEVVREGLEHLSVKELTNEERRERLKRALQVGIDQLDRGEGIELTEDNLDAFFDDLNR